MECDPQSTAVVFIDPQNDVLSPAGKNWAAVGASVTENKTVEHMREIFEAAKSSDYQVFISPHYFYPTDHNWVFNGPLETDEFCTGTFDRTGPLDLSGFVGSGADWLDEFKPFIDDGKTIVVSPHKVFGLANQRSNTAASKATVIQKDLGGMLANMCVESHLRDLLEQGFEVAVVRDATAGPRHPNWGDGYQAALRVTRFLAHEVVGTEDVVAAMRRS